MNFVTLMKKSGLETATEATVLFDEVPAFHAEELMSHLTAILGKDPVVFDKEEVAGPNRYLTLRAGGCRLVIESGNDIRQPAAYFEALEWPMLHRTFPDAEEVVRKHYGHVHITVEAEYDAVANALGMRSMNTSYARNLLAARVLAAVCRIAMPLAIYWKGCEMLHRPNSFLRELETEPVNIFTRVTPFSSNRQIAGTRVIGASTRGASDLLGVEAVLEEAPVSVDWAMNMLQEFVARSHARNGYLPHLSTFAPGRGDIMIVRHFPSTPEIDQEHVSLEVRRAEQFDYDASGNGSMDDFLKPEQPRWDGVERRSRPRNAPQFGRRGLN